MCLFVILFLKGALLSLIFIFLILFFPHGYVVYYESRTNTIHHSMAQILKYEVYSSAIKCLPTKNILNLSIYKKREQLEIKMGLNVSVLSRFFAN